MVADKFKEMTEKNERAQDLLNNRISQAAKGGMGGGPMAGGGGGRGGRGGAAMGGGGRGVGGMGRGEGG